MNRVCRQLRKRKSKEAETEYQNAWTAYMRQEQVVKRKIMHATVKFERNVIQSLRKKGVEGGREWFTFLRGEGMSDSENVESLGVNLALVTKT